MRPCTPDALPVMGRIPGIEGAYISCGHNCWGILWAPICGLAMAELVAHGRAGCVDLAPFTPDRYMKVGDSGMGRGRKKREQAVGEQW
jgi:glycine/D-amino acid oxidase-like deaminating enzyme